MNRPTKKIILAGTGDFTKNGSTKRVEILGAYAA